MSTDGWSSNFGITLPNNENATHNIGFSPIFFSGFGQITTLDKGFIAREGIGSDFWSSISAKETQSRLIAINNASIWPSTLWNRGYSYPLRCLVSTTNS